MMPELPKNANIRIRMTPEIYHGLVIPQGFLTDDPACHALFRYYTIARTNQEHEETGIEYEGELSQRFNYRQLFSSIAFMYGVAPERMVKFWLNVDMQCRLHPSGSLPLLTGEHRRFEKTHNIKSN